MNVITSDQTELRETKAAEHREIGLRQYRRAQGPPKGYPSGYAESHILWSLRGQGVDVCSGFLVRQGNRSERDVNMSLLI